MKQTDTGIILHKINYSESSLILTLYTRNNGLQRYIFQGGKKKHSAVFPMSHVEFTYYSRPDSELGKMTEASSTGISVEIPFHPLRSSIAFFLADVLRQCLKTEQKDVSLFEFLEKKIELLNREDQLGSFPHETLTQLTHHLGLMPNVEPGDYFLLQEGSFSEHHAFDQTAEKGEAVDAFRMLLLNEIPQPFHSVQRKQTLNLILRYYNLHVPNFNVERSLEVLREIME